MDHLSSQIHSAFGSKSLYEILEVSTTATVEEIKKSYRKLALKYHPDKGGNEDLFKALSVAHSILSDNENRTSYDENGNMNDTNEEMGDFNYWYDYYRRLFPKITINDIESFSIKYKGSTEERSDIIEAYQHTKGNLKQLMQKIMFAEDGDEPRIIEIIEAAIADNDLIETKQYTITKANILIKKPTKKRKQSKLENDHQSVDDDLAQLILNKNRQNGTSSNMANILDKYGNVDDNISDHEFNEIQQRLLTNKKNQKLDAKSELRSKGVSNQNGITGDSKKKKKKV